MLCTEVIGRLEDERFAGMGVDYVELDWHEAFKKLHRKTSVGGREVGIRLGDWVLAKGLSSGDVLGVDEGGEAAVAVAVRLLPTKCLVIDVDPGHAFMLAKVGWEVGNTHTPLFFGEGGYQLLCEYAETTERLLAGLHGVSVTVGECVLDPSSRVSANAHHHHHDHDGHDHEHGHCRDHGYDHGHPHCHDEA